MAGIVVITTKGRQKLDFVNELQRRTNDVRLVVVQTPKQKTFANRVRHFRKRAGRNIFSEAYYFLKTRRSPIVGEVSRMRKSFTPYDAEKEEYVPQTLYTTNVNSKKVVQAISDIQPSILVIWGGFIVKKDILGQATKAVNIHQGLCPMYRGSNGNLHAILREGLSAAGVTIHYAVEKVDAGNILARIEGDSTKKPLEFFRDLNDRATREYLEIIARLVNGEVIEGEKQDIHTGHNYLLKEWSYKKLWLLSKKLHSLSHS